MLVTGNDRQAKDWGDDGGAGSELERGSQGAGKVRRDPLLRIGRNVLGDSNSDPGSKVFREPGG